MPLYFIDVDHTPMMSSSRQLEVQHQDTDPQRWRHPLTENNHLSRLSTVFGPGSLFSPLLFGKFFDPSDAFPLWEFDAQALLRSPRTVDWFQTDADYVLKAELQGIRNLQVIVENGKILEMSGVWKQQQTESSGGMEEWKSGRWWEHGCTRRLELPEKSDWAKTEAYWQNDSLLEIRIPKNMLQ